MLGTWVEVLQLPFVLGTRVEVLQFPFVLGTRVEVLQLPFVLGTRVEVLQLPFVLGTGLWHYIDLSWCYEPDAICYWLLNVWLIAVKGCVPSTLCLLGE